MVVGGMAEGEEDEAPAEVPNAPPPLDAVVAQNPHCAQLMAAAAQPFVAEALRRRALGHGDRYMSPAWPRMRYQMRQDADRSSCHWGQLKLFESELHCLTDFVTGCGGAVGSTAAVAASSTEGAVSMPAVSSSISPLVVYVGAAPGRHVPSLVRRFPGCRFELFDPAPFDEGLVDFAAASESGGRVRLRQAFFDEEAAEELRQRLEQGSCRPLVFFSDIRTADEKLQDEAQVQVTILDDMQRQRRWVEALQPDLSILKFRLPWGPGKTCYLPGRLLVQAFPPCTSTETRLLVRRADLAGQPAVEYDQEEYEERLMHHNTVTRASLHTFGAAIDGIDGLDGCFDCAALVDTVRRFLAAARGVEAQDVGAQELRDELAAILQEIGGQSDRTLATPYHVSSSRHAGRHFNRRKYRDDDGKDCFAVVGTKQARAKRRRKNQQQAAAAAADEDGEAAE